MAGGIRKAALLEHFAPDARGMQFLTRLGGFGDDAILRAWLRSWKATASRFWSPPCFLRSLSDAAGPLTARVARCGAVDGHPVRTRGGEGDRAVRHRPERGGQRRRRPGVEAIEGTDETVRRPPGQAPSS